MSGATNPDAWAPGGRQQQGYAAPGGVGQPAPPYGRQPVGYQQAPLPYDPQQAAISRAKSEAMYVIVISIIGFFTMPLLLLGAAWIRGQRLCWNVSELGASPGVVAKAKVARGIAIGGFTLQACLVAWLIIAENFLR